MFSMKNIKKLSLLGVFAVVFAFTSCSDNTPEITSKVTNYPDVTINGDALVVLTEGTPYEELGAVATAGSAELDVVTEGTVGTAPGYYKVTYSATNSDGFPATRTRTVIVMDDAPSALNLEGTFFRSGNAANNVRISDRVYTNDNAGGLAHSPTNDPNFLSVTFYVYDDQHIYIPEQVTSSGITVESLQGDIVSNDNFKWVLAASSFYGTAVRNFVR